MSLPNTNNPDYSSHIFSPPSKRWSDENSIDGFDLEKLPNFGYLKFSRFGYFSHCLKKGAMNKTGIEIRLATNSLHI